MSHRIHSWVYIFLRPQAKENQMRWTDNIPNRPSMSTLMDEYCEAVDKNLAVIREGHEALDELLASSRVTKKLVDSQ